VMGLQGPERIPVLWLLRQRRWRGLLPELAAVSAIVLVDTARGRSRRLAAGGPGWATAPRRKPLLTRSTATRTQRTLRARVCGRVWSAHGRRLAFRGRRGLAALGLASLFASPALWPHGFVFALPAVLMLESGTAVWLVLGAGAFGPNIVASLRGRLARGGRGQAISRPAVSIHSPGRTDRGAPDGPPSAGRTARSGRTRRPTWAERAGARTRRPPRAERAAPRAGSAAPPAS